MYLYTCICASMYKCMHVCMYVREDLYVYIGIRYTCIYVCTIQLYLYIKIYIYIFTYMREIIVVRRWTIHRTCHSKWKIDLFKKSKKLKAPFFEARWLVQPGQTLWNQCVFWCGYYCSSATVISVQLHDRNTGVASKMCTCARNVIIQSPPRPTMISVARHRHRRSIKDVYMSKERYHPIPTPPQPTPLWSPANDNDHGYILYVYIL